MFFSPLKPIFNLHTIYEKPDYREQVYEIKWSHCWRVNVGEIRHRRTPALHGPILLHNNTTTLIPYSSIFHPASAAYTCSGCVCVSLPILQSSPSSHGAPSQISCFFCVSSNSFLSAFSRPFPLIAHQGRGSLRRSCVLSWQPTLHCRGSSLF